MKDDPKTGKRIVAGTHWDFDSYGGTIKKQLGMPTQVLYSLLLSFLRFSVCLQALNSCLREGLLRPPAYQQPGTFCVLDLGPSEVQFECASAACNVSWQA